ncbi:MerR family transcriptional regulator [Xylanimonas allomyrinae]|uniref:MerR family transcriptional regulator n=1 Tax=Xylanimonas allomyrinae TaxID=2509459 RepID=A0A4P6EMQ5_9MICO|nr:MerR family transcriptional regulator [Xylanimonas allomyrinae]QAY64160.1 MerR family transcriptional regulator [Xylanimonas allomyrinae]
MNDDAPVLTVTQAATLAGMHPQTLRQYDRLGLVVPRRTVGRGRRYSRRDVARLLEVQRLAQVEGINLAGIKRILDLERHVSVLEEKLAELIAYQTQQFQAERRVFAAGAEGEVVVVQRGRRARSVDIDSHGSLSGGALVLWRPGRGSREA